ncbi:MAG: PD40 domain-containing protein, partial [Gemmatimonadetes bacterium]|nr:PD40 domain-containing protein [Gemmatimonadota bacterium]
MRKDRRAYPVLTLALVFAALLASPLPLPAQYFGRNKVRYDDFDFKVLKTSHFDIHFYPEATDAVADGARMAERWYERLARTFQHEFKDRKPLVLYADHPDFQQTNTLEGFIDEGTGGVTESAKNRVILPITGSYQDTDHVLGHELVHAFQYDIALSKNGGGLGRMSQLGLWFIEGMAEYLSVGRESPLTAMWLRDAVLRDDFPTIAKLMNDYRYFPYRFGQALWAYIGGTYGDDAVVTLYRRGLQLGMEGAFQEVLGIEGDSLSVVWRQAVESAYRPLLDGRMAPADFGRVLASPATGAGRTNLAPSVSPDGRHFAFISEKDLFAMDLFLADASTGKVIRKLASSGADPHFDALRYLDSSGSWSPDSRKLVFVVAAAGDHQLAIVDVESGEIERKIPVDGVGAISGPAWSPDGRSIAFSGSQGGMSDLYLIDVDSPASLHRLTNDRYADLQPAWSPDGRTLAFVSDRGPETDYDHLSYSSYQIALLDLATSSVHVLPLFGNVDHVNPQFAADGALYFLSDQDGFSDIYRATLGTTRVSAGDGEVTVRAPVVEVADINRITRVATAVSGVTRLSPAFSVAQNAPIVVLSLFNERGFSIHALDGTLTGTPVERVAATSSPEPAIGRMLPPASPATESLVESYLADAATGLASKETYALAAAPQYRPGLSLDGIGPLNLGVAADGFGTYFGGEVSGYFSDMLGDRFLYASLLANGGWKDIGGQLFYVNRGHRLTWGANVGRTPIVYGYQTYGLGSGGSVSTQQILYRTYIDEVSGLVAYPLSSTRRLEGGLGLTRYSFDLEVRELTTNRLGQVLDRSSERSEIADPLSLSRASIALVGDNSFFAYTSPVSGGRYRLELEGVAGSLSYGGLLADYRRYFRPVPELTVALRGYHYGRYGNLSGLEERGIQPLFLGYETLVRGYAYESYDASECTATDASAPAVTGCAQLDRLFGNRLAAANLEVRVPLTGDERFGLLPFRFLPIELGAFVDGGLAWDNTRPADLSWSTAAAARVPVFSTG